MSVDIGLDPIRGLAEIDPISFGIEGTGSVLSHRAETYQLDRGSVVLKFGVEKMRLISVLPLVVASSHTGQPNLRNPCLVQRPVSFVRVLRGHSD